jgi:hypothetical protein
MQIILPLGLCIDRFIGFIDFHYHVYTETQKKPTEQNERIIFNKNRINEKSP